jgi:hypothetical protein
MKYLTSPANSFIYRFYAKLPDNSFIYRIYAYAPAYGVSSDWLKESLFGQVLCFQIYTNCRSVGPHSRFPF